MNIKIIDFYIQHVYYFFLFFTQSVWFISAETFEKNVLLAYKFDLFMPFNWIIDIYRHNKKDFNIDLQVIIMSRCGVRKKIYRFSTIQHRDYCF